MCCRVVLKQFNAVLFVHLPKMNDIRAVKQNDITMKNLLSILALVLCVGFVSCHEEYDPDTAESYYEPISGKRLVASVKTVFSENGGENSHEHRFAYDAKGRIKTINSDIVIYTPVVINNNGFRDTLNYRCNITSSANYFYRGEELEVAYTISTEYPDLPSMNRTSSSSNFGVFNSDGVLNRFSTASYEYSATLLKQAYTDGDVCLDVVRDSDGNVSGYKKYVVESGQVLENRVGDYHYHLVRNKTNFDFSAYFGYWGVEQCVPVISRPYRAPFQLAAFGMLGATSPYLPFGVIEKDVDGNGTHVYGKWELDSKEYPVSYVDTEGRKTIITYCE